MDDNQNYPPERMLDAGQSCPGMMLSGRGTGTHRRYLSKEPLPPWCHTERGDSERLWPALDRRRFANGKKGSSCRVLLEVMCCDVVAPVADRTEGGYNQSIQARKRSFLRADR
jgi:hypothetical protein